MGKLLKFEFSKLIKAKVFYVCLAISTFLVILAAVITEKDFVSTTGYIRMYGSASMLTTILAIAVCCFVCEDAQCGAEKTVLGRGVSRNKFFFAKYISSLVAAFIFSLVIIGITSIVAVIRYDYVTDNTIVPAIFLSLLGILMLHGFFFGISTISGKTGASIAMTILIPMVLSVVVAVLDYFFPIDDFSFGIISISDTFTRLGMYTEMNSDMGWSIAMAIIIPIGMVVAGREIYIRKEN